MSKSLLTLNEKTNKLSVYLSDVNINSSSYDYKCELSHALLNFLKSSEKGICQIKVATQDMSYIYNEILGYFDLMFPKRIYIIFDK